jgi:hypothetical protein
VTGRRGIRRRKLLDGLKERRGYSHLKEEALYRTMWRARFGRGFGPVRQTTEWMNEFSLSTATLIGRHSCHHACVTRPNSCLHWKLGQNIRLKTVVLTQNVTRWLNRCNRYHKSYPQRWSSFVFIFVVAYNILFRWLRQLSRVTETNSELRFIFPLWVANKKISKGCYWLWLFWSYLQSLLFRLRLLQWGTK